MGRIVLRKKLINSSKNSSGITLIELLLTVTILTTITLLSTSFYSRFMNQNAAVNAEDQIINSLRKAQIYSMMGKENSAWGVNYNNSTITLFMGSSFAGHNASFDETYSVSNALTVSGLSDIIFAKLTGLPTPTSATVTIAGSGSTKSFTVNSQGVVDRVN